MSEKIEKKVALITGGTRGIGLATALAFARQGYRCILTYKWGSVSPEEVTQKFAAENLELPCLKEADVIQLKETQQLFNEISQDYPKVDVFISNVSFCNLVRGIEDFSERALLKSIEYSSWPLVEYPKQMKKILGAYPQYVIGLSSDGVDKAFPHYDFVAASKAILEVFVRYLNYHFFEQNIHFNMVRTRGILTESLLSTFGQNFKKFISENDISGTEVKLEDVANTIMMLCSGFMDGIRGQTLNVDKGYSFANSLEGLYYEQENETNKKNILQ